MDILDRLKELPAYRFIGAKTISDAIDEIARLRAEVEELRVDAERYVEVRRRAKKSTAVAMFDFGWRWECVFYSAGNDSDFDAAIDAARGGK